MKRINSWLTRWVASVLILSSTFIVRATGIISLASITVMYWTVCAFLVVMGSLVLDLNRDD